MATPKPRCPICRKSIDNDHFDHILQPAWASVDEPLAFVIDVQRFYDRASSVARWLGIARQELKTYFPGKEFEIQPARLMLTKEGENSVLLGEAHVATYVVFEK